MANLLKQGMNYRQIGEIYGLAANTVGARLRRMSNSPVGYGTKSSRVEKREFIILYQVDKLPLSKIAESLGISIKSVQKLLKRYEIPKRPHLPKEQKYSELIRELQIGKTIELTYTSLHTPQKLRETAKKLGIKIVVRQIDSFQCKVSKLDSNQTRKTFDVSNIDPNQLREL